MTPGLAALPDANTFRRTGRYLATHKESGEKVQAVRVTGDDFASGTTVTFANGRDAKLSPGDWLVLHVDGTTDVLSDDEFRPRYSPATMAATEAYRTNGDGAGTGWTG